MGNIPESDWKKMGAMKESVLNSACESIFEKIETVLEKRGTKNHKAYLELWKIMQAEDENISTMFDDLKRSNAIFKLASWKRNGLISAGEFRSFSKETQEKLELLNEIIL